MPNLTSTVIITYYFVTLSSLQFILMAAVESWELCRCKYFVVQCITVWSCDGV